MHRILGQVTETNIHNRIVPMKIPATCIPRGLSLIHI